MLPLARFLLWCQLPLFSLSEGPRVHTLWWECRDSPTVLVGQGEGAGSLCTVGGRPPSPSGVADCHSVEELGFQILERRDVTLSQGCAVWSAGLLCTWGNRASGAICRVAGYRFPPLSVESGVLVLWWGNEGSPAVRDSGEHWASMPCGEGSFLFPAESKPGAWVLLRCVVASFWQWVTSWGYPWGSKASGLEYLVPARQQRP
jgi:hypothetical protein